jgi:two-component system cell cycle response regulator
VAGTILFVDPVATNRIVMKVRLGSAHYATLQVASGDEAMGAARGEAKAPRPDLAILAGPADGALALCARLRADPLTRTLPVIILADAGMTPADRRTALAAGADDLFQRPVDDRLLLARIRSLLRGREPAEALGLHAEADLRGLAEAAPAFEGAGLIGLIGARVETGLAWKRALQPHVRDRLLVLDRDAALSPDPGSGSDPDLFLVDMDYHGPHGGLSLLTELRARTDTRHAALCLATDGPPDSEAAMALDLGAAALIDMTAPAAEAALRLATELARKRRADQLRLSVADGLRAAVIDPLTGLHNRRHALPELARIARRAGESGRSFGVLILDLDRFKAVNDSWGHAAGDQVLAEVARRLRAELRAQDLIARIGGEEFLIALPDASATTARAVADRLLAAARARPVTLPGGTDVPVTLSIGLAMGLPADGPTPDELLARADRALMAAKAEGRDQVWTDRSAA